jgi:signal transduction histidine kinase
MGIGAYESRDYIRRIGGSLSVESIVGVGTTFIVSLPLAVPPRDNVQMEDGNNA